MKNEIIIFENQNVKLEVNMKEENVWLNTEQMAQLFKKDRTVITRHINNIFKEGELDQKSNVQKMHFPNSDKLVSLYNLDVIISVGYRVKSQNGTEWFGTGSFVPSKSKVVHKYALTISFPETGQNQNEDKGKNLAAYVTVDSVSNYYNVNIELNGGIIAGGFNTNFTAEKN